MLRLWILLFLLHSLVAQSQSRTVRYLLNSNYQLSITKKINLSGSTVNQFQFLETYDDKTFVAAGVNDAKTSIGIYNKNTSSPSYLSSNQVHLKGGGEITALEVVGEQIFLLQDNRLNLLKITDQKLQLIG